LTNTTLRAPEIPVRPSVTARAFPWLALAAVTSAIALYRLGSKSLWYDEAFSYAIARLDVHTMGRLLVHGDSFNTLYYAMLHVWQFAGRDEAWLRLPSSVAGATAVLGVYGVNRRLFGNRVAAISAALLAINAFFVRYEQEARAYSMAVLLAVVATFLLVRAVERRSTVAWVVYGTIGGIAVYAHLFSAFVIAAHLVSLPLIRQRLRMRDVSIGFGIAMALPIPLVWSIARSDPLWRDFIPPLGASSVGRFFLDLTGGGATTRIGGLLLLTAYFTVCFLGVVRMTARFLRPEADRPPLERWGYMLVAAWLAVPVGIAVVVSIFRPPILYPRYLLVCLPALVTLAAIGIDAIRSRALMFVALIGVVALAMPPLLSYYGTSYKEGEDWRDAAAYVGRRAEPGDAIVFLSRYGRHAYEYYLEPSSAAVLEPAYPSLAWGRYLPVLSDESLPWSTAAAARILHVNGFPRVWIVLSWGGFHTGHEDPLPIQRELEQYYRGAGGRSFGSQLAIALYRRSLDEP
jgi:mannosyltransferase